MWIYIKNLRLLQNSNNFILVKFWRFTFDHKICVHTEHCMGRLVHGEFFELLILKKWTCYNINELRLHLLAEKTTTTSRTLKQWQSQVLEKWNNGTTVFSKYLINFIYKHIFFKVSHYVTFFVISEFAIKIFFAKF